MDLLLPQVKQFLTVLRSKNFRAAKTDDSLVLHKHKCTRVIVQVMIRRFHHFLLSALVCFIPGAVFSQGSEGPLGDLFLAKEGGLRHYSSYDSTGNNADFKRIEPGQTLVLVDHKGAGVLRRWWLTIAPRNIVDVHRSLIIRCYWDGEKEPSVEVPVSDFFGMGFGKWKDFISTPLNMTSGGYNSYWPMPFHRSAYITVENRGNIPVSSFYYNIDIRTYNKLSQDALYFHAQ